MSYVCLLGFLKFGLTDGSEAESKLKERTNKSAQYIRYVPSVITIILAVAVLWSGFICQHLQYE